MLYILSRAHRAVRRERGLGGSEEPGRIVFFFSFFSFFGGWGVHLPQALSQVVTALRAQLSNYDGTSPLLRVGIKNAARRPTSPVNREHRADIPMAH